ACAAALAPYVDFDVVQVLRSGRLPERADVVQPVLWAVMVALAGVWRSFGVEPAGVIGHSQGEIAAAVVAGALSLEDGAAVVALRSRALRALSGSGAMASIAAPVEEVERLTAGYAGVEVAVVNGPAATVVSGPVAAVEALVAACETQGVRARRIAVDYASHCALVEPIADQVRAIGVEPRSADVPFYSTVTGERIDTAGLDGGYWYANLRGRVRFADAVAAARADGHGVFIEVSPHPVLTMNIDDAVAIGTLHRDEGGMDRFLLSAGEAFVAGVPVTWPKVDAVPAQLPTYPFQHQRYWLDAPAPRTDARHLGLTPGGHPFLGAALDTADGGGSVRTGRISLQTHPWLADHAVWGRVLVPGTAFVDLVLQAGDEVEELTVQEPMTLPEHGGVHIQLTVGPEDETGRCAVSVHSRPEDAEPGTPWTCHVTGGVGGGTAADPADDLTAWPPPGATPVDVDGRYDELAGQGYDYGPAFQGLRAAWRSGDTVYAEVSLPAELEGDA